MESINNLSSNYSDYDMWEYLLVAHPSKEVIKKILEEKEFFNDKYDNDYTLHPHITIANFLAKEAMEETFIRWMQNICNLHKSFTVTLNNYSGLPSSGLYLRVLDAEPFKRLANALRIVDGFMESNDCPSLNLVSKPHLTFVTGLSEYAYTNAIKEYAGKIFHESFRVDKLTLLKRDIDRKCHLINTFILPPPLTFFE